MSFVVVKTGKVVAKKGNLKCRKQPMDFVLVPVCYYIVSGGLMTGFICTSSMVCPWVQIKPCQSDSNNYQKIIVSTVK